MKINTSFLSGHRLDWMVAKAVGLDLDIGTECCGCGVQNSAYEPPECCGSPILVPVWRGSNMRYQPSAEPQDVEPLREIVRGKFGDIVDFPDELL